LARHTPPLSLPAPSRKRASSAPSEPSPAGIDAVLVSYYRMVFPRLKPSTQAMRRNILERFRAAHGNKPVAQLERRHIDDMIAALAKTPHAANNLLKVLRHLLEHAVDINLIKANPALKVKKFKTEGDGIHTWTEDEVARFVARHAADSRAYLAMMLMLYTGQRKSDAVRMGWQHVRNGKIAVRQEKTGASLLIPIAPELAAALAIVPRTNMTFLLTERGAPFTAAGFGNWFRDRCDEAGLPQCSSHGLRKLTATRLAELGCSEREIMAITGHKSVSEVSRLYQGGRAIEARRARDGEVWRGRHNKESREGQRMSDDNIARAVDKLAEDPDLRSAILRDVIQQVVTADETKLQQMRTLYGAEVIDAMVAAQAKFHKRSGNLSTTPTPLCPPNEKISNIK
jgi:integrase